VLIAASALCWGLQFAFLNPAAVLALVLLGGPAGVGGSLLFAHLKHTGAAPGDMVRTRALVP
jgi:SET family sugar efflux transporter-like MFS transporter